MNKTLARALKDAANEGRLSMGTRTVLASVEKSGLVVLSESDGSGLRHRIMENAKSANIPLVQFGDTSVALGKLCGMQFRVSALAVQDIDKSVIGAILQENDED